MARKLTPITALALAAQHEFGDPEIAWSDIPSQSRRIEAAESRRILGHLRKLGFDIVPRRTTKGSP